MTDDVDSWKRRSTPGGAMAPFLATARSASRRIDALETRAPLEYAAISKGGLRIRDGGLLTVMDGGNVVVQDGGDVQVRDGGTLAAYYPNGQMSMGFGPLAGNWWGLLVYDDAARDILRAYYDSVGNGRYVYIGHENNPVALFTAWAAQAYVRATNGIYLNGGTGQVHIDGSTVFIKVAGTTTVAANTYISAGSGLAALYQVSSSRRYKEDIADHHSDQAALLAARPVSWRDKAEVEADPDTTARYVGFIAEELDDLGLTEYVTYNPDGSPESVAYDRLTVGLLDLAKTQAQQIAWLSEQVAALTGQTMPDFTPEPTEPIAATRPAPAPSPAPEPTSDTPKEE